MSATNSICFQYNDGGVPDGSRLDVQKDPQFQKKIEWLKSPEGQKQIATIRQLSDFAEKGLFLFYWFLILTACTLRYSS